MNRYGFSFAAKLLLICVLSIFLLASLPVLALCQGGTAGDSEVSEARASAKATIGTFLKAMNDLKDGKKSRLNDAVACLDLSAVSITVREEIGKERALQLYSVINKTIYVKMDTIPDDPAGSDYVMWRFKSGNIVVKKQESGEWLFSARTVAAIPELEREVGDLENVAGVTDAPSSVSPSIWLRSQVPGSLKKVFIFIELYQWIGILVLILIGIILDRISVLILSRIFKRWLEGNKVWIDKSIQANSVRPFGILVMSAFWWFGIIWLGLPENALALLWTAVKVMAASAGVWCVYRMIDVGAGYFSYKAEQTETKIDDILVPLIRKSLKVFTVAFGIVFVASSTGWDPKGILAGIGLGGLAFALAAKDLVANLFGSVAILLDRTFKIGDWIIVGNVEGSVEELGFRSTRIRTFYNSLIVMPNANLISTAVDNMGERRYRRIKCMISITYSTPPEKIEAFCEGIREILRLHPYSRKDYYHVWMNKFSASSLDILLYCFVETPDWATELREKHRLFLDIIRLANKLGVEFAFPTQTLHMQQSEPRDMPEPPADAKDAYKLGRKEAEEIVSSTLGKPGEIPPPVKFD